MPRVATSVSSDVTEHNPGPFEATRTSRVVAHVDGAAPRSGEGNASVGRLSKRQKRRQRKAVADPSSLAHHLPPELNERLARAEAALRARHGDPEPAHPVPPTPRRPKRRRSGQGKPLRVARDAGVAQSTSEASTPSSTTMPTPATGKPRPFEETRASQPLYAALDLGTNNCRLLIATPTRPGQFRVVDAFSRIVRVGEGLSRTGSLASTAMDRALGALEICANKLAAREITGARLIATEACRAAANGPEFIERVVRVTGLELEIVSRETEARLAVSGCGSLVDRSAHGAVLFDIGGGSTEIALLDLRAGYTRRLSSHIVAWTSLPVGVVTLAEEFGGRHVPPEIFEAMVDSVLAAISGFRGRDRLAGIVGGENFHLMGTSGTVTTLAGVHLGLDRYDRRQVDGLWLSDDDVGALLARISSWSFEERIANPCIGSERADLVLAGCAIFEAIRRTWPSRQLRVADRGLREGLLTEMMVADGVWRRPQTTPAGANGRTGA